VLRLITEIAARKPPALRRGEEGGLFFCIEVFVLYLNYEALENNPDSEIQIFRPNIWKTKAPSYIIKKQKHQLIYFIKTLQSLSVKS